MLQTAPMINFRNFLFCSALFVVTTADAQKNYKRSHFQMLDQARVLLAAEDYEQAAKLYKRLAPVDTNFADAAYEFGICLWNIPGLRDHAFPHFERAVRKNHSEAYYQLGLARHRQMRFEEAIELFERYKKLHLRNYKDADVDRCLAMCKSGRQLVKDPVEVKIRNLGPMINSTAHDYSPLVTADGNTMYFTSRRQGTRGGMKDMTGQYLEDIYVARRIDDIWTNAVNAGTTLNTISHDATVGLNPDGSSMIVYRTGKDLVSGDLYEARLHAMQWQSPVLMTDRINSKSHEPSASIAPGGDEIYFSSDRSGGFGGRDLYRIRRLPNGEWSLPLNLGPSVNTAQDEDAPFMHSDGITLFFSSNGHNTMGGFDIFKSVLTDSDMNGWGRPVNLGFPLNTVNDDIYFSLNEDGTTGYFSSERPGGIGMQDIYQIIFPGSQLDHVFVRGVVADAGDEPVKARIILTDPSTEEVIGVYNINESTGRFFILLAQDQRCQMTVESPGFMVHESEITGRPNVPGSREMELDVLLIASPDRDRLTRTE
jgi:hypothetical protein